MNNQSINKNLSNNVSDELLYEFVMDEMEQESELIKGLWAKALAHSEGNDSKAKSLYMQYRVQAIKDHLSVLQIDLGDLSKEELFESIKNGFTVIPEKIQMIKEQKAVAVEKAIEVAIEEEAKKENEKYGKLGGWLIVLAVFIVLGVLLGFLRVERFFENEHLDTLNLLYQNGMDQKASLLNAIAYMSFVSYSLLLAFTISFFRKAASTKTLAIIYFGSNVIAFPIVTYLLIKIDLPTISVMSGVIGGVIQTLFALILIRYFMVSERVEKTFVNGSNDDDNHIMTTLIISLGVILLTSVLYAKQSDKNTLMAEQNTTAVIQTTSEDEPAARAMTAEEILAAEDAAAPAADMATPVAAPVAEVVMPAADSYATEIAAPAAELSETEKAEFDCNNGKMDRCADVAIVNSNGKFINGVYHNDVHKAVKYAKKACAGGDADGCNLLAAHYSLGNGVQRDEDKSFLYYKKACSGGIAEACWHVGISYNVGLGVQKNHDLSLMYHKKACDGGYADGCSEYEKLQTQGY